MPHILRMELSRLSGILISSSSFRINGLVEIIDFHFMRILCVCSHHAIFIRTTTSRILLLILVGMVDIILALILLILRETALLHRRLVMLVRLVTLVIFLALRVTI